MYTITYCNNTIINMYIDNYCNNFYTQFSEKKIGKNTMKVSGGKICILIIIVITFAHNFLIINLVSNNRRKTNTNMPLSQNIKDN